MEGTVKVLLVEDVATEARMFQASIATGWSNLEVVWVRDLAAGREAAGQQNFDVVVLDLHLPSDSSQKPRSSHSKSTSGSKRTRSRARQPAHSASFARPVSSKGSTWARWIAVPNDFTACGFAGHSSMRRASSRFSSGPNVAISVRTRDG